MITDKDLWFRNTEGTGYTQNLKRADPEDVKIKHEAASRVNTGQAADLQEALVQVRNELAWTNMAKIDMPENPLFTDADPITVVEFQADPPNPAAQPENVSWAVTVGEDLPGPSPSSFVQFMPSETPPVAGVMKEVLADGPPLVMTAERYLPPNIRPLPRVEIPDHHAYYPHIGAWLATGEPAREGLRNVLTSPPTTMAVDIEADGLGAASFVVKCVTLSWCRFNDPEQTMGVYLDPLRNQEDRRLLHEVLDHAEALVLHNAPYDIPPLYQHGLISMAAIDKVHDTAVYARMAYPDKLTPKNLDGLATSDLVGFPKAEVTMAQVFKASGLTIAEGYRQFDGNRPIYRLGAMADTVATLRLLRPIQAATWSRLVEGHPFAAQGVDANGALELMEREQRVNRIMMRRSARGLGVDTEYLSTYEQTHARELTAARDALSVAGLDPDAGNLGFLLVSKLEEIGELPPGWPRTGTGRLRATKDDMEVLGRLGHPLAQSARRVAELTKVSGYLDKVNEMVRVTGLVHPQVSILGASATGRMSYSLPELHQFPADARPIIVSDSGLTSVDWSQIEPVVMATCAKDHEYLAGFNAGTADLYAPVQAAAGVERKVAKVLLLAVMYGRGAASTAAQLGVGDDEARTLIDAMLGGMPVTRDFISVIRSIAEEHSLIITAAGRILPIPVDPSTGRVLAYKAVNYFCQGSAYDVLADTLVRLDDAGVADEIHLAMHDELVVSTSAAAEVQAAMEAPPTFLGRWTDLSTVRLRTDANELGRTWLYV